MKNPASYPNAPTAHSGRKFVFLGAAVLIIILAWCGFWAFSHSRTQSLIDRLMARQINGQQLLSCKDQNLGGFPFRLLLTCSSYQINDPRSGWHIAGGPLRAVWQVYAPNLALLETREQLQADHRSSNASLTIQSSLIRASLRFSPTDFISRASLEASDPTFTSNNPYIQQMIGSLRAKTITFHARPTPDSTENLDVALAGQDVSLEQTPFFTGEISATILKGLSPDIRNRTNPLHVWLQQSGKVEKLKSQILIGQKTLRLNGALAFNRSGQADGNLKLKILNPRPEDTKMGKELKAKTDGWNGPLTALQLMGKPTTDGNLVGSEIPISITKSRIQAGILPLGSLPPLQ